MFEEMKKLRRIEKMPTAYFEDAFQANEGTASNGK